jgi:hypothetical protein
MSYKSRTKENNQFKIGYSYPGLCSFCFDEVAEFDGSKNGVPVITQFKPNHDIVILTLDDGSMMGINLCTDCAENLATKDFGELMESEINGWQAEVDRTDWKDAQKRKYMKEYSKRHAVGRIDKPLSLDEIKQIKKPRKSKLKVKV